MNLINLIIIIKLFQIAFDRFLCFFVFIFKRNPFNKFMNAWQLHVLKIRFVHFLKIHADECFGRNGSVSKVLNIMLVKKVWGVLIECKLRLTSFIVVQEVHLYVLSLLKGCWLLYVEWGRVCMENIIVFSYRSIVSLSLFQVLIWEKGFLVMIKIGLVEISFVIIYFILFF